MLDILKNTLATVAPSLGQAVGGPLGGAAANMIASVLGCKAEPKSIAQAMQNATPEQLLELKKAEKELNFHENHGKKVNTNVRRMAA